MRKFRLVLAFIAMAAVAVLVAMQVRMLNAQTLAPMLRVPCTVVEVVDGDTVTVELRLRARVRLKDCWAPELNEPGGQEARDAMVRFTRNKDAVLEVPFDRMNRLDDVLSFGRIVGRVYADGRDVGNRLIEGGLATSTRSE